MTPPRLASLLLAIPALAACTEHGGSHPDGPPAADDPVVPGAPGCVQDRPEQTTIGCGFGPGITPVAAADGTVYVVSTLGTYTAIDLAEGSKLRLYRNLFSSNAHALARGVVVHDGTLFFPTPILFDDFVMNGLVSIPGDAVTPDDEPEVLQYGEAYDPIAAMVDDGQRLYAASIGHIEFSAFEGPVIAIDYAGTSQTAVTTEGGAPIAVVDGTLWYRAQAGVKRMPVGGGTAELIASGLTSASLTDRAVDADHVYASTDAAPYVIRRLGAGGASDVVHTASEGDVEVPLGAPYDLRLEGDVLYFMQDLSVGYAQLSRVRLDGSGEAEAIAQGESLKTPVFDETGIYIAYTRGGGDEPIEGVVARIAK